MRIRKEIEEEYVSGVTDITSKMLEVLLDIRELLKNKKQEDGE